MSTLWPIEKYRPQLLLLARAQLSPRWHLRFDPSDLVQETLLEAHRDIAAFRGSSTAQFEAWLRQILFRNLANLVRDQRRECRDADRERRLGDLLTSSSARVEAWFVDDELSPQQLAERADLFQHISSALANLPENQRLAIESRYVHGLSLAETSKIISCTESAVAGLLQRGLRRLREQFGLHT